jgi:hypothetical protein
MHLFDYLLKFRITVADKDDFISTYKTINEYSEKQDFLVQFLHGLNDKIFTKYSERIPHLLQLSNKRGVNNNFKIFNGHLVHLDTLMIVSCPIRKFNNIKQNCDAKFASRSINPNLFTFYEAIDGTTIALSYQDSCSGDVQKSMIGGKWLISTVRTINAGVYDFSSNKNIYMIVRDLLNESNIDANSLDANYTYNFVIREKELNPTHKGEPMMNFICKAKIDSDEIIYDYTMDKLFKKTKKNPKCKIEHMRQVDIGKHKRVTLESLIQFCAKAKSSADFGLLVIFKSNQVNDIDYHIYTKYTDLIKKWIYTPMFETHDIKQLAINIFMLSDNADDIEIMEEIVPDFEPHFATLNVIYMSIVAAIKNIKKTNYSCEPEIKQIAIDIMDANKEIENVSTTNLNKIIASTIKGNNVIFQTFCKIVLK